MRLRATIPFRAFLTAERAEDLTVALQFNYKRSNASITFNADTRLLASGSQRHFRRLTAMLIEIDQGQSVLQELVDAEDAQPLLKFVLNAANRVLLAIRNFGVVAHVNELRISDESTEQIDRWLRMLHVELKASALTRIDPVLLSKGDPDSEHGS